MKEQIIEKIKENDTIIIHRHERPDPDAIGSQAGLAILIKENYPHKTVYMTGEEAPTLSFMATMDQVPDRAFPNALIIICDTANTERISDKRYEKGKYVIKIDHHPNEDRYGNLLWVDTGASSTSEMIADLYITGATLDQWKMPACAARLLFTGIVGDTGRFRFSNTTAKTFSVCAQLLKHDIGMENLFSTFYAKPSNVLRLEGYVLEHFDMTENGLAVMILDKKLLDHYGVSVEESSAVIHAFSDCKGLKAWVFFVEEEKQFRVRIRSKGPIINGVAKRYGGGGHPMAAGAMAKDRETMEKIIADLEEVCLQYENE